MKQKHGRKSKIAALLAACALTVSAMIAGGTLSVSADAGEAKENVGGIFLISGGTAANGDYSYDENNSLLTILKSTPITIKSVNNQFVNAKIFIKNGVDANITLDSLRIKTTDGAAISMGDSSANVTITIKDGTSNYLNGVNAAGIEKLSENGRLTITCEHADEENHQCSESCGLLDARCGQGHGAGIGASGCNYGTETGGIYIKGGVILAVGNDGAGIGGSNLADVSDINISGGIIEARGDNGAAGIGSATNGGIGSINISGGIISAYGSAFRNSSGNHFYGAAIGAAYCSRFDSINISGGTIYANTAYDSNGTGAVAVGAGNNCNSDRTGIIRISDGVVYAVGSGSADAIGVSDSGADPADIVIDGGSVYPKCGDDCTVHSDKIGMSSLPKDSSGRELTLLEIDNSGNESITVNRKAYPSNSTYNTGFDNSTEVKKSYVFIPKSGRNSVTVGNTTTDYIYTESGLVNAEDMKLDFYAADSNKPLVYGTDYKIDGIPLTILSDKGITVKNVDPTQPCSNYIYIESGVSANITFAGINIQRGLNELSAVEIAENSSGNVNIILADNTDNIISTTYNCAALSKNSDSAECGTLTISCQHSGEAGHICGSSCGGLNAASSNYPAAIGGDYNAKANNITVNGGIINAESVFGAAIGSGQGGSADGIYINGGIVNAVITYNADDTDSYGCAIGSGADGEAENIYISGGIVTAHGGYKSYALGGCKNCESNRNYIIDGGLVYLADDESMCLKPFSSDKLVNNSGDQVYPIAISNPNCEEITINGTTQQYRFLSSSDMTFYAYVPKDIAGTASVKVGDKQYSYGLNEGIFEEMGSDLVIKGDNEILEYGLEYTYPAKTGILTVNNCAGSVTIQNADKSVPTTDRIFIGSDKTPTDINVTLAGVNIHCPSMQNDSSALCIADDNNVSITLADGTVNTLISDSSYGCGIAKDGTGTLTITCEQAINDSSHKCGENCGTLNATANKYGAAIGSTSGQYNGKTAQNIIVCGGNINASSKRGAAIGGGQCANGENIRIENSILYAASEGAAIIGGGIDGTGSNIYIKNSVVSLVQKGFCGCDMIGNGSDGTASEIYIDNSSVAMYSTNTSDPDISQNSQIKNSAGEPVYMLTIDNPNGDEIIVDGVKAIAANNIAADPNDTGLHLWLAGCDHLLTVTDADGNVTQIDYHFDSSSNVFRLCEADIDGGYYFNKTAHWYVCKNSYLCTVKFNYQEHFGGNATCTNKAVCEACGYEYGELLGHNYKFSGYVRETCTTDGHLPYYYCDRCEKYFERETDALDTELSELIIPATGHSMTKVDAVPVSCEANGRIEYYKCGNCSKLFTDADGKNEITYADTVIAAKGHRYLTSWTFDSDSHWHKCDVCGSVDKIEPHVSSGHATETAAETCTICGYEIAPMLGHIHANNLMPVYAVKPTCTKDGNIGYYVCSCGKMFADSNAATALTEADIVIPAAGHGATEIRNRVEPTETANGYTGDEYCTVCNELVKRGTVIPATASSGTTTTPSEPTSAPSGTTTTPSEPTSAPSGTTTTPSEPTSALTGTTTTLSEPTSALTGTTTTPSETTSALTGTTTTPSETTSAQSGTTTTPSETSATTTLPPEDAELPFIKDEGGRVIVDENDHAADNESGDAEKSENDETNPVTGAAVAGLIALIILAAAVAVVLSRKKK